MKAVTFGEIMMRLNPEGYLRFVQANSFEVSYAGGEANVAVSLANYGVDAAFVSKVPAHEIGQCVVNELRRYGVDTKYLLRGGPRLGVYYCEKARPSAHPRSYMTAPGRRSRRQRRRNSTGMAFLRVLTGSTGPELLLLWAARCRKPACRRARPQRKRA